jgi:hypothetical protein
MELILFQIFIKLIKDVLLYLQDLAKFYLTIVVLFAKYFVFLDKI